MDQVVHWIAANITSIVAILGLGFTFWQKRNETFELKLRLKKLEQELTREREQATILDNQIAVDTSSKATLTIKDLIELVSKLTKELDTVKRDFNDRLNKLQEELDQKDEIIENWSQGIQLLINQLTGLDEPPCWKPDIKKKEDVW